jgi:hypothetical protein
MPEARTPNLPRLQGLVADLVLAPEADAFREDPVAFAADHGLGPDDQSALVLHRDRWLLYRDLVRTALEDPLQDAFPITRALLARDAAWAWAVDAFLASRTVSSPYYRDVAPAFVAWLAETRWGQERWPFLLQLAHYEVLELDVVRHPDGPPPPGLLREPAADLVAVLDPAARNVAYGFAVQAATAEAPEPPSACAWLLCHRDRDGAFRVLELTPHVSALLARSQEGQALGPAAEELGLDPAAAFDLLRDFRDRGALLGFRQA